MKGLMNCMACFSTKGLSTQITFIWLLSSVNYPMIWKVCILFKAVATNITFIWSLSSMNSAMNLKRYISFKAAAAHITFIWFLTSVNYPMILKVCILFKAVATNITFMWSLSSMNSVMNLKRCISFKAAATHITFICFLSSVNYPMSLKVYILFKAVATYITFIWFLSCIISPMNCMGCIIIKGLATYVTFIWFPSFYMDSFLSREFWVLKKGSVTLIRVFLVCFLVWCLFWGMCDSTLMFMRNASVDTTSSLRWQTWGDTVDIRHNLTTLKNCSFRLNYLQFILKAWFMPFNRLISCIISTLMISSISEISVMDYRHSFVISFITCPQTLKIMHSFLHLPEEVIFDFMAFSSSQHHFLSNFSFSTVSCSL